MAYTYTPKSIFAGNPSSSPADIYTVPTGKKTKLKGFSLTKTGSTAASVTIWLRVKLGASVPARANSNAFILNLDGRQGYPINGTADILLEEGSIVSVRNSGGTVALFLDVAEREEAT